jgi:hypothetical protein
MKKKKYYIKEHNHNTPFQLDACLGIKKQCGVDGGRCKAQ